MNITHIWELNCYDSRKSFYGKAHVLEDDAGNAYLKSYDTIVCYIDASGHFHRLWGGYSATTQRHINSFIIEFRLSPAYAGKRHWESMEVESA
jgi:hypothetical protein